MNFIANEKINEKIGKKPRAGQRQGKHPLKILPGKQHSFHQKSGEENTDRQNWNQKPQDRFGQSPQKKIKKPVNRQEANQLILKMNENTQWNTNKKYPPPEVAQNIKASSILQRRFKNF